MGYEMFAIATATLLVRAAASPDWIGQNFQQLREKTLLEITLPGSHNSGNYQGGLHTDVLCESDYRYNEYVASPSSRLLQASGRPVLSQMEFDRRMLPWNINHFRPIKAQLEDGIRFLHLKICNFGVPGAQSMDLAAVRFQHRGYTTRETVASTIQDLHSFLEEYPKEIVVLGFNNLHNSASKFGQADIRALSNALETAIGEKLINKKQLFSNSIGDLVEAGRRVVVFLKDADPDSSYIIPGQMALAENWSPVMASGDLLGSKNWLLQDLQSSATQGLYYVMQANPNNAESKMYEAMNSNTAPMSNLEFLRGFLLDLPDFILQAVAANPRIQINVIDSDFLNISKPYETAMKLMGLPGPSTMLEESSGLTILPILLYIAAFCILFGLLHCMDVFSGASGGPCRPSSWSHIWVVKQTHFERLS